MENLSNWNLVKKKEQQKLLTLKELVFAQPQVSRHQGQRQSSPNPRHLAPHRCLNVVWRKNGLLRGSAG